jgi:hypothetical protein
MVSAMLFGLGLLFSVLGGGMMFLGWSGEQQLYAAYLSCNHSPTGRYCDRIYNGAGLDEPMQELSLLIILFGITMIVLGLFRKRAAKIW